MVRLHSLSAAATRPAHLTVCHKSDRSRLFVAESNGRFHAIDVAKSGSRGCNFRFDVFWSDQSFVCQELGQVVQTLLIECWIEQEQQTAFDEIAQCADPFMLDDFSDEGIRETGTRRTAFSNRSLA